MISIDPAVSNELDAMMQDVRRWVLRSIGSLDGRISWTNLLETEAVDQKLRIWRLSRKIMTGEDVLGDGDPPTEELVEGRNEDFAPCHRSLAGFLEDSRGGGLSPDGDGSHMSLLNLYLRLVLDFKDYRPPELGDLDHGRLPESYVEGFFRLASLVQTLLMIGAVELPLKIPEMFPRFHGYSSHVRFYTSSLFWADTNFVSVADENLRMDRSGLITLLEHWADGPYPEDFIMESVRMQISGDSGSGAQ